MIEGTRSIATALLLLAGALPAGQEPAPAPPRPDPEQRQGKEKKKEARPVRWPRLTGAGRKKAAHLLTRLVRTDAKKRPELLERTRQALLAMGPGIVPQVLGRMKDGRRQDNARLRRLALALAERKYAAAAVPHLSHRFACVRETAARMLRKAPDPAVLPGLLQAFGREKEGPVKEMMAFGLCHLGSVEGLPLLFRVARREFLPRREEILAAARGVQGEKAARWLEERLAGEEKMEKLAALRLLAMAGDRRSARKAAALLESRDHTLVSAAINVLRALIDGKPPRKHMSVFQMIEAKKRWRKRL
jgi:hypothetical protein